MLLWPTLRYPPVVLADLTEYGILLGIIAVGVAAFYLFVKFVQWIGGGFR